VPGWNVFFVNKKVECASLKSIRALNNCTWRACDGSALERRFSCDSAKPRRASLTRLAYRLVASIKYVVNALGTCIDTCMCEGGQTANLKTQRCLMSFYIDLTFMERA